MNQLAVVRNNQQIDLVGAAAEQGGWTQLQVDLIRNTVAQDCSDREIAQFLIVAAKTQLDPLSKQIYMMKRRQKVDGEWRDFATPQTGIDGYRLIADRTNKYAPGREPTFAYTEAGGLFSATAYVMKFAGGTWHEVAATAMYAEYVQTKANGEPNAMWVKMPHNQLAKCAEALALRRAFPAELSGLYTHEEMEQADPNPVVIGRLEQSLMRPVPAWIVDLQNFAQEQGLTWAEAREILEPIFGKDWKRADAPDMKQAIIDALARETQGEEARI